MLPAITRLALAFPAVTIVVDHCGGSYSPRHMPVDSPAFEQWCRDLGDLARRCPNVVLKLGGAQLGGFGFGRRDRPERPVNSLELAAALLPYFRAAVAAFGPGVAVPPPLRARRRACGVDVGMHRSPPHCDS